MSNLLEALKAARAAQQASAHPVTPRPLKRKRLGDDSPGPSTSRGTLTPIGESADDENGNLAGASTDDSRRLTKKARTCFGCKRTQGQARSHTVPNVHVEWPYQDGRGNVCLTCLQTWKSGLKDTVLQTGLETWVSDNPLKWQWMRVASTSLRVEGFTRVDPQMIANRVRLLQWLFQYMGVLDAMLLGTTVVTPLRQAGSEFEGRPLPPLVNMFIDGKFDIGFISAAPTSSTPSFAIQHVAQNTIQSHNTHFYTDHQASMDVFSALSAACGNIESLMETLDSIVPEPSDESGVLSGPGAPQVQTAQALPRALVSMFSSGSWKLAAEARFTKPLGDLGKARQIAAAVGTTDLVTSVDKWTSGVMDAKSVVRLHRAYVRFGNHTKFMELDPSLPNLVAFLDSVPIQVCGTLRLTLAKLLFYVQHSVNGSIADAFAVLKDHSVFEVIEKLGTDEKKSFDTNTWFRQFLVRTSTVALAKIDVNDDNLDALFHDFAKTFTLGHQMFASFAPRALAVLEDSQALSTLYCVAGDYHPEGQPEITAAAARDARKLVKEGSLKQDLATKWKKGAGAEIFARIGNYVTVCAADRIGDAKMASANEAMVGPELALIIEHKRPDDNADAGFLPDEDDAEDLDLFGDGETARQEVDGTILFLFVVIRPISLSAPSSRRSRWLWRQRSYGPRPARNLPMVTCASTTIPSWRSAGHGTKLRRCI